MIEPDIIRVVNESVRAYVPSEILAALQFVTGLALFLMVFALRGLSPRFRGNGNCPMDRSTLFLSRIGLWGEAIYGIALMHDAWFSRNPTLPFAIGFGATVLLVRIRGFYTAIRDRSMT